MAVCAWLIKLFMMQSYDFWIVDLLVYLPKDGVYVLYPWISSAYHILHNK